MQRAIKIFLNVSITFTLTMRASPILAAVTVKFSGQNEAPALLAAALSSTKHHLDVVLPMLPSEELGNLLSAIAAKGVTVQLILPRSSLKQAGPDCLPCAELTKAGIRWRSLNRPLKYAFFVADGPKQAEAGGSNRATLVLVSSKFFSDKQALATFIEMTAERTYLLGFQDEFNYLWSKTRAYSHAAASPDKQSPQDSNPKLFTSAQYVPMPVGRQWTLRPRSQSPEDLAPQSSLIAAIKSATRTIDLTAAFLNRQELREALEEVQSKGIKIRIASQEAIDPFMIIDSRKVLARQADLDSAGSPENFGSLLILEGPAAAAFKKQFNAMAPTPLSPASQKPISMKQAATPPKKTSDAQ